MSRYTDIANAEADEAEAEAEAAEDEAETTDDTPQEPAAEAPPVDVEKAMKKLDQENVRHAAAVERIMGADFALCYPCPTCVDFAAGFTMTPPNEAPPMLEGAEFERCDKCNGYGSVITGALTEHGATTTCRKCSGQGYVEVPLQAPTAPTPIAPAVFTGAVDAASYDIAAQLRAQGFMVIDPPRQAPTPGV